MTENGVNLADLTKQKDRLTTIILVLVSAGLVLAVYLITKDTVFGKYFSGFIFLSFLLSSIFYIRKRNKAASQTNLKFWANLFFSSTAGFFALLTGYCAPIKVAAFILMILTLLFLLIVFRFYKVETKLKILSTKTN